MGDPSSRSPAAASRRDPASGGGLVLVVDDEPAVLRVAAMALKMAGYRVLTAESGAEALRLAERWSEDPQLLISDLVMPGMDGPTLFERLRQRYPHLRGLLTSGASGEMLAEMGYGEPGLELLAKPWTLGEFLRRVGQLARPG